MIKQKEGVCSKSTPVPRTATKLLESADGQGQYALDSLGLGTNSKALVGCPGIAFVSRSRIA
ncbi:hypothetical protein WK36_10485 [Burkholderia cepacia]|nr:hypothetical protein WK36_10485 [Burkholderia cepacia]